MDSCESPRIVANRTMKSNSSSKDQDIHGGNGTPKSRISIASGRGFSRSPELRKSSQLSSRKVEKMDQQQLLDMDDSGQLSRKPS